MKHRDLNEAVEKIKERIDSIRLEYMETRENDKQVMKLLGRAFGALDELADYDLNDDGDHS